MEIIRELLKTTKGKLLVFGGVVLLIIGLVLVFIYRNNITSGESITYLDDPSGQKVYITNAEKEGEIDTPIIIGFDIFYDFGFSSTQQNKIYETVHTYFKENFPSFTRISYIKDSFKYTSADESDESTFLVASDTGQKFSVLLKTNYSYIDINVTISEL